MVTLTSRTLKSGNLVTWQSQHYCILRSKELLLWNTQSRELDVVVFGKDKWIEELEINISGRKWQQPFDGNLQKAVAKKIIIWKKVPIVMDKYEQILMNKASWNFDETKSDHFFEKSSSMNALIVAKWMPQLCEASNRATVEQDCAVWQRCLRNQLIIC